MRLPIFLLFFVQRRSNPPAPLQQEQQWYRCSPALLIGTFEQRRPRSF